MVLAASQPINADSSIYVVIEGQADPASVLRLRMQTEPLSLNPITADGASAADINAFVVESLLALDQETNRWIPQLADRFTRATDGRSFEFHLRTGARWSDAMPVTAFDVKFSFDAIFDDRYRAAHMRPYYEGIAGVDVLDESTVRFRTGGVYYADLAACAQLPIVPRHVYELRAGAASAFNVGLQGTVIGSGPYVFASWQAGRSIRLDRNPLWWGGGGASPTPNQDGRPESLRFLFVSDDSVALQLMRRRELDYTPLTGDEYARLEAEAKNPRQGSDFTVVRVRNQSPKNVKSVVFNLERPLFQDPRVREALNLLADREGMIRRFFHGYMAAAAGPWYKQNAYADGRVSPLPFDPARALELLRGAGWNDAEGEFTLSRLVDGKKTDLRFELLVFDRDDLRYLTALKEDARQIGVAIELKVVGESAFNEALRTGQFEAADFSHGAVWVEFDPKSSWHSTRFPDAGINYGRYAQPEADALIDQALRELDGGRRIPIMQALFRTIARALPEIFLFNETDTFYAVQKRVERDRDSYGYDVGINRWRVTAGEGEK